jgi:hypothetical protein
VNVQGDFDCCAPGRCHECGGYGAVLNYERDGRDAYDECTDCGGTGVDAYRGREEADYRRLIADARDYAGADEYGGAVLLRNIADALEAYLSIGPDRG